MVAIRLLFYLLIMQCLSCKSSQNQTEDRNLINAVETLLGKQSTCIENESKTLVLCQKENDQYDDPWQKDYAVFSKDGQIKLDKSMLYGKVTWHDNNTIMLESYPRIIDKMDDKAPVISFRSILNEPR